MKLQIVRAHQESEYGKRWADRAVAVDTHGCFVFIINDSFGLFGDKDPIKMTYRDGQDEFSSLYEKALLK